MVSGYPSVCIKNALADVTDGLEELTKVSSLLPDHSVIGWFGI